MVKQKFDPGNLIFRKVKGYPPWPARVTAVNSKDRYQKKCNENRMVDNVQICNFFSISMTIVAYPNPIFADAHRCASCGHFEMRLTSVGLMVPKL